MPCGAETNHFPAGEIRGVQRKARDDLGGEERGDRYRYQNFLYRNSIPIPDNWNLRYRYGYQNFFTPRIFLRLFHLLAAGRSIPPLATPLEHLCDWYF